MTSNLGSKFGTVDATTFKYYKESEVIGWDFTKRLRAGQTVASGSVVVEDADGNIVTSALVDTTTILTPNNVSLTIQTKANGGVIGKTYYVLFLATTSNPSSVIANALALEIR